jgi:hypothetical protein
MSVEGECAMHKMTPVCLLLACTAAFAASDPRHRTPSRTWATAVLALQRGDTNQFLECFTPESVDLVKHILDPDSKERVERFFPISPLKDRVPKQHTAKQWGEAVVGFKIGALLYREAWAKLKLTSVDGCLAEHLGLRGFSRDRPVPELRNVQFVAPDRVYADSYDRGVFARMFAFYQTPAGWKLDFALHMLVAGSFMRGAGEGIDITGGITKRPLRRPPPPTKPSPPR